MTNGYDTSGNMTSQIDTTSGSDGAKWTYDYNPKTGTMDCSGLPGQRCSATGPREQGAGADGLCAMSLSMPCTTTRRVPGFPLRAGAAWRAPAARARSAQNSPAPLSKDRGNGYGLVPEYLVGRGCDKDGFTRQ